jgi:hypothetical protein
MQIPKDEQLNIWKWVHASDSFDHADFELKSILKTGDKDIKVFKNMLTAFYISYGRPFGFSKGIGRLDTCLIPKEYLTLHKEIINYRDQYFAHNDLNAKSIDNIDFIDTMQIIIEKGKLNWNLKFYLPNKKRLLEYQQLINVLMIKCNYYIGKFNDKYLIKTTLSDGKYRLNLRGESNYTFTKVE